MKKTLIGAAILLACISTLAKAQVPVQRIAPVRYEFLFQIAQHSCYRLKDDKKLEEWVTRIRDSFKLTSDEVNLYLNYCMLYDQGYNRKIPR